MQNENSALWIKNPLSILADGAGGGVVLQAGRLVPDAVLRGFDQTGLAA